MSVIQPKKSFNPVRFLLYVPVPWVFVLGYLAGLIPQFYFPAIIQSHETQLVIKIAGAFLFIIAAIFASWSLIIFRKAHTTTTPGESSNKLIISGPYRFSRNPMYVSLALAYLGEEGLLVQFWPFLTLILVLVYVNWVVIPLEEEVLKRDYKLDYINYCTHVRRWL